MALSNGGEDAPIATGYKPTPHRRREEAAAGGAAGGGRKRPLIEPEEEEEEVLEEEIQDDEEEEMDVEEERHEVDEEEGQSNVPRRGRDRLPSHNTEIMSRFVSGGTGKVAVWMLGLVKL